MKKTIYFTIMLLTWLFCHPSALLAATFIVDTTADEVDATTGDGICLTASSTCSLRAAVEEANAWAGDDSISLPAGTHTLSLVTHSSSSFASGSLFVEDNLTISGTGMTASIIDGGGTAATGFIMTDGTSNLTLLDLKITNVAGPAIYWLGTGAGSLDLTSVDISGNTDGGILLINDGNLTILNSNISNNIGNNRAGIDMEGGSGNLTISGSTIAQNSGGLNGGGLRATGIATAKIYNSTISGNSAGNCAGGIFFSGTSLEIYSSTITGNNGDLMGGGLTVVSGSNAQIKNTIIAGNIVSSRATADCRGTITSNGYNLIGDKSGCTVTATTGDQFGDSGSGAVINAGLDTLANNGGNTQTHALQITSPAKNAADPSGCTDPDGAVLSYDQRGSGYDRIKFTACDVGAFELQYYCGDGTVDPGEACDDGNATNGDGCTSTCVIEICGDAVVNNSGTETCDDGNTTNGDGCSSACAYEPPVADGGLDSISGLNARANLDGTGSSDPSGSRLTYVWQMTSRPRGSTLTTRNISGASSARAYFYPDVRGTYTFMLTVINRRGDTDSDTVTVVIR